ncbi:CubicO group peptidase (beta-lactamase class C family) [Povalibacter uvarum]|uniref:CubicO group peptidase (Beta-lactamase class C family) n=1 Tax=Povalibacter uvarum TaxID=732238 RepID=A0A841HSU7_9GAMM|nr:serine hydrolase domain-containing protein [Povalibacter uvarum]MBB6095290.1 CubicO group peptidase (beta-lactamase class C family) [Povalibacter uvarum]
MKVVPSLLATLFAMNALSATDTPSPEAAGFSASKLQRLTEKFEGDVKAGTIPGAVVLVVRNGKVAYFQHFGDRDRPAKAPMQPDALFRIASMTKPVTSVAALMLMEEGKLQLGDPVSKYLPQLKQMQVGVEKAEGSERTLALEPSRREMTIQDLMRHTSGFTYGIFGDSLVQRANRAANTMDDQQTNAELIDKLAKLPLAYQPGTTFEYGMSTDVLGRVVEVVSGMDLNRFVVERIAKPLGMNDTAFQLSPQQAARLAEPLRDPKAPVIGYNPARPPKWFSGGGGLVSTAHDYARFSQMLLNGGELDGVRLLSRKSVELMTSNHLPPGVAYGGFVQELGLTAPLPQLGQGYGLGVGVRLEPGRGTVPGSVGDYFWGGATGPYFWIDPKEQLIAIMMLQELNIERRTYYRSIMRNLVYQAME